MKVTTFVEQKLNNKLKNSTHQNSFFRIFHCNLKCKVVSIVHMNVTNEKIVKQNKINTKIKFYSYSVLYVLQSRKCLVILKYNLKKTFCHVVIIKFIGFLEMRE